MATALAVLASYAAVVLAGDAILAAAWTVLLRRRLSPTLLLALRLAPSAAALVAALLVGCAFALHEPGGAESYPAHVWALAACTPLFVALSAWRARRVQAATTRVVESWSRRSAALATTSGVPCFRVEDDAPQACVAGLRRPRVFVTSALLESVSADELELVLRHEESHARHAHNVARALLRATPDALGGTAIADAIENAWNAAAELTADREAVAGDRDRALQLAATLVRIGRQGLRPAPVLLAAALTPGAVLEQRVRELVQPSGGNHGTPRLVAALVAVAAMAAIAAAVDLRGVHAVLETFVAAR